jgi:hypothetical protein
LLLAKLPEGERLTRVGEISACKLKVDSTEEIPSGVTCMTGMLVADGFRLLERSGEAELDFESGSESGTK